MALYEVNFDIRSVILPIQHQEHQVSESGVAMILDTAGLVWKSEHHITALSADFGRQLRPKQFQIIGEFLAQTDCIDYTVENEAFMISKSKDGFIPGFRDRIIYPRKSLVAPAHSRQMLDDLLVAYDLAGVPDEETEFPFQHVTLATGTRSYVERRGIGLSSKKELERHQIGESILGWKRGTDIDHDEGPRLAERR